LLASNERRSALTSVKSSKAIYHYKRGILLTSSNNVNDYIGLGKLLANQDNFVEAKEYFLKALRLEPGHLEAQLELNKIIIN
jgi:tetratricopeptide (TPR) repeat protein